MAKAQPEPIRTFKYLLKWWLFLFLVVLIPLDLIYRLGSLLEARSLFELAADFSSLVILFTAFTFVLASFLTILSLPFNFIPAKPNLLVIVNAILGFIFLITTFVYYLSIWLEKLYLINNTAIFEIILILFFLIILLLMVIKRKISLVDAAETVSERFYKTEMTIILFSILVAALNVTVTFLQRPEINKKYVSENAVIKKTRPNIILITFDALAANRTSLHNKSLNTTPNLVEFAKTSYFFSHMYASSNWTLPSLYGLLTGRYPTDPALASMYYFSFKREDRTRNLPAILRNLGYDTAAVVANPLVIPWRINLQGFNSCYADFWLSNPYLNAFHMPSAVLIQPLMTSFMKCIYYSGFHSGAWLFQLIYEPLPLAYTNAVVKWLYHKIDSRALIKEQESFAKFSAHHSLTTAANILQKCKKPFFIWVHILPPHDPYLSHCASTFSKEGIMDEINNFYYKTYSFVRYNRYDIKDQPKIQKMAHSYDAYLQSADRNFGDFLFLIKQHGFFKNSIIIVTSDHGEMFERGFWEHGGPYLYQSLIHIPFLIHLPGQTESRQITSNLSNVDVAPTILELLGCQPPAWMDGSSFKCILEKKPFESGTKYSMNLSFVNDSKDFQTRSISAIRGNFKIIKYLRFNQYEMYDLGNDPGEKVNLVNNPRLFSSLNKELIKFTSYRSLK